MPTRSPRPLSPAPSPALRLGAATLLLVPLLAACHGRSDVGEAADAVADTADTADADPSEVEEPESEPFTIAFGGDVMFEGILRERLDADPETAVGPIAEVFAESDLGMVNLETAVTEGGTPAPDKEFRFRAPPTAYTALAAADVDVASLANNHGMDYGLDGLEDTLDHAAEAEFPVVGIGRDADEAYAPHVVEVNGNTVALFGATDVLDAHLIPEWTAGDDTPGLASTKDGELDRMLAAVEDAAAEADTVVVYLHWGLEGDHCPLPHAPDLAGQLVDAGATVVVGGHAHVLGPGGYLDDAYVHYGLGNFVFYNFSGPTAESGVLRLTVWEDEVLDDEWLPARIEGGVPVRHEGDAEAAALETWEGYPARCGLELGADPPTR